MTLTEEGELSTPGWRWAAGWTTAASAETLRKILVCSRRIVDGSDGGAVSVTIGGKAWVTPVWSDPLMLQLDELQRSTGEGPTVEALRHTGVIISDDLLGDARWPAFGALAGRAGVWSAISFQVAGRGAVNVVTLYAARAAAFSGNQLARIPSFAAEAGNAIAAAQSLELAASTLAKTIQGKPTDEGAKRLVAVPPNSESRDAGDEAKTLDLSRFGTAGPAPAPSPSGNADTPAIEIAVLLPCLNEEATIAKVVRDFKKALPTASVYVYDNASTDRTAERAQQAGAIYRWVGRPGKGNVLRRMFSEVDASIYVLADGDDTYDASAAPFMVQHLIENRLDMVVGRRIECGALSQAYRKGHRLGNRLLTNSVEWLFHASCRDMLSGYRVFSWRYVKSFPALCSGFEVETEMTVHAIDLDLPFEEVPTRYRERPSESRSKLKTIPDGYRILRYILLLCKLHRPLLFFGVLSVVAAVLSLLSGDIAQLVGEEWLHPYLALGFSAAAPVFILAGVVLHGMGRDRKHIKRMLHQAIPAGLSEHSKSVSATSFTDNPQPRLFGP